MAQRKAQSRENTTKIRASLISAALDVAGRSPWEFVSLLEIAESAGVSLEKLTELFPQKSDILAFILDDLDRQVEEAFPEIENDMSVRDRLFDVLMERIEFANQHRAAHISFFKSFGWTKGAACQDVALMRKSMGRMAKCAGIETRGLSGEIKLTGLSVAYLWVLLIWTQDTSRDLGKTMAELDRTLNRLQSVASYFSI